VEEETLQTCVFAYWSGKMAVLSQGIKVAGAANRTVYNVGVIFDVTNDMLISGADSTLGNPTAEQLEKMERAAVGTLAAFGAGIILTDMATGLLVGTAVGGPAGAAVGVVVAGVAGVATSMMYDAFRGYQS
jgi:hypothetical protein